MKIARLMWLSLALLYSVSAVSGQALDAKEQAISEWIDAHIDESIALIEKLVNINSGTMNHEGVKAVGSILRKEFDALGLSTEWIDLPPETQRAGHLFARTEGDRGKKILLIGHLDTVFAADDPFQTFQRDGDTATGPGVDDMKGGNVIILYALKALQAVGVLEGAQVIAAFSGDEEAPGDPLDVVRADLIKAGRWADVALGFESAITRDGKDWASTARRGFSTWKLEVTGKQAHSSLIFGKDVGAGAVFEAARILAAFYTELGGEQYLTFNAGNILGGTTVDYRDSDNRGSAFGKNNVVPSRVLVHGGIRTLSADQLSRAKDAMQALVAQNLPHTEATLTFVDKYPPMSPTEGNRRLRTLLSDINSQLGRGPMPELDPTLRGAADISFVAPYTDALAGMGTIGGGDHTPQEKLDLASMSLIIKRAALMIYRLSR